MNLNSFSEFFIYYQGNVELWLGKMLEVVRNTMHTYIRKAHQAISDKAGFKLIDFENVFISQCGLLGIQMVWTRDSEEALSNAKSDKKVIYVILFDIFNVD